MSQEVKPHVHDMAFGGLSSRQDEVFFVQVGAADGRRVDPIHPFVKRYDWRGILVEPLSDLFELLKQNYHEQQGLIFENLAITEKEEERSISRIPLDRVGKDGVPAWAFGASSLLPEKTRFAVENSPEQLHSALSSAVIEEKVQCISLSALLERHKVEQLDVLQLDTEGYDAKILKQLDFSRFHPAIINMEWLWLTDKERDEVSGLLRSHGYSLYPCEADLLATSVPVEQMCASVLPVSADTVPRFYPGVIGLVSNNDIDMSNGSCACEIAQIEIVRSRGTRINMRGNDVLFGLLRAVDGARSYQEIGKQLNCDVGNLLELSKKLKQLYVFE